MDHFSEAIGQLIVLTIGQQKSIFNVKLDPYNLIFLYIVYCDTNLLKILLIL